MQYENMGIWDQSDWQLRGHMFGEAWLLGNRLGKLQEAHFNLDMEMLYRASEITVHLGGVTSVHVHVYTQLTTKLFATFMTMTKK